MKNGLKLSSAFLCLALLAVMVRALIPAGFMPNTSKTYALTICSGLTTKTIFVHDDKAPAGHQDQKKDISETCPFAAPVLAAAPHFFDVLDYMDVAYARFIPLDFADVNTSKLVLKSYHSQGPPEISAV